VHTSLQVKQYKGQAELWLTTRVNPASAGTAHRRPPLPHPLCQRETGHIHKHTTRTTPQTTTRRTPPPHLPTIEGGAATVRILPSTPGWVAAPKSAWEVGSKSNAPWGALGSGAPRLGLYKILSLPILYGVWHIKGGSGGSHMWRKRRAIVLL